MENLFRLSLILATFIGSQAFHLLSKQNRLWPLQVIAMGKKTNKLGAKNFQYFCSKSNEIIALPKLQVVMDMDECMLCCDEELGSRFGKKPEFEIFSIKLQDSPGNMRFHLRPGLLNFLHEVSVFADIHVMTTAKACYAIPALKVIDTNGTIFKEILARERLNYEGKNLELLGSYYDERRTVLVDNMPSNFNYQPSNGIWVQSFYDNPSDNHLNDVLKLLNILRDVPDVRKVLEPLIIDDYTRHTYAGDIVTRLEKL